METVVRKCQLCSKLFEVTEAPGQEGKRYCSRKHKFKAHQKRRKIRKKVSVQVP